MLSIKSFTLTNSRRAADEEVMYREVEPETVLLLVFSTYPHALNK